MIRIPSWNTRRPLANRLAVPDLFNPPFSCNPSSCRSSCTCSKCRFVQLSIRRHHTRGIARKQGGLPAVFASVEASLSTDETTPDGRSIFSV